MIDHRTFVAWTPDPWGEDRHGREVLELLQRHGLKPNHYLLDFGCGSLRVGRWLIEYLNADRYFGIDPEKWLIEEAKAKEIPAEVWETKSPSFDYNTEWLMDVFGGVEFDYVLISDVFLHAAHWQIENMLYGVAKSLAPNGVCLGNIILPEESSSVKEDYTGEEWQYPEGNSTVRIAPHHPSCLADPAAKYGLTCEAVDVVERGPSPLHWFKFTRVEQ